MTTIRIVKFNGKKILVHTIGKGSVIECFEYALKYFKQTSIKENKKTYTIKFNNGSYDYTYVLSKEIIYRYNLVY